MKRRIPHCFSKALCDIVIFISFFAIILIINGCSFSLLELGAWIRFLEMWVASMGLFLVICTVCTMIRKADLFRQFPSYTYQPPAQAANTWQKFP